MSTKEDEAIKEEVLYGGLPVLGDDRIYRLFDYILLQAAYGIASWAFLVGSLTGLVVGAFDSTATALFGNAIGLYPAAFYAILFGRYGVDQFLLTRSAWGNRGGNWQLYLWIPINWGWMAYSAFLMGQSFRRILPVVWESAPQFLTVEFPGATIFAYIALIVGMYVAWRGPLALKWFTRFTTPLIIIIIAGLIYYIFTQVGIGNLFQMAPPVPEGASTPGLYSTYKLNWMNALEWNVGLGFAWTYYWGQWSRLSKSETGAHHGPFWGWGPVMCVAVVFSAFVAIVTGYYDPTAWFVDLGGAFWGAIGLVVFGLANTGSVALLIYTAAIPLKVVHKELKWIHAAVTVQIPAALLCFGPVFSNYNVFLTLVGNIWTVYGAVVLADFMMRRKWGFFQTEHIRDMYKQGSLFWYHGGFNLAAWITLAISVPLYWGIYDPIMGTVGYFGWGFPQIPGLLTVFAFGVIFYPILFKLFYSDHFKKVYGSS